VCVDGSRTAAEGGCGLRVSRLLQALSGRFPIPEVFVFALAFLLSIYHIGAIKERRSFKGIMVFRIKIHSKRLNRES